MKRFFIIASMAILAIACQKTEIQNEVQNQIGFSTETGKLTRAIVQNDPNSPTEPVDHPKEQPFAMYAYGWQDGNPTNVDADGDPIPVMNNVEISYTAATNSTPSKWAATITDGVTVKYYWPNDYRTKMNFYAYSPAANTANKSANIDPHQTMRFVQGGGVSHDETNGLVLTGYIHDNMYVDFMVAKPVTEATYSDQDGVEGTATNLSSVPLSFGHKMTQVNFTVKIADNTDFHDVDFTINSIVLNNIKSQGTYTNNSTTDAWDFDRSPVTDSYRIYPATIVPYSSQNDYPYSYGAPTLNNANADNVEKFVVLRTDGDTRTDVLNTQNCPGRSFSTTPVTMIPQNEWTATTGDSNQDGIDDAAQSFTISYTISGTGVATETVVKTFNFADALTTTTVPTWDINKKVTYTLTISLNEITFAPTVSSWSDEGGDYYNPENIAPEEEEEEEGI